MQPLTWQQALQGEHALRCEKGLWRSREPLATAQQVRVRSAQRALINFSSNDYLGFANHPRLISAASEANRLWGVGSGASHLVCGHQTPHHRLETELAQFVGAESALLFSSGYMANLALASSFAQKEDLILQDKLNHASLIDGGQSSPADFKRYVHCDAAHAARSLAANEYRRCVIMTDGVFSMDGDIAPLYKLNELAERNRGLLIVDDAHGFGVRGANGRGSLDACGLKPAGDVLMMATLGKALGSYGAFVAGDKIFIEHLIQNARSYIYTTAIPPAVAETSRAAVQLLKEQGAALQAALQTNITHFKAGAARLGFDLLPSNTAIQPWIVGDAKAATHAADQLLHAGFKVIAIRPPTVLANTARLRIALSAAHGKKDIDALLAAMESVTLV